MTDGFNPELAELERERRYREVSERWTELEQKRLNEIFAVLGSSIDADSSRPRLSFGESSTLGKVRSDVEAGGRNAMLTLLSITADALRHFGELPKDVRAALANGLEKMRHKLEESKEFLPRKRGQKSADSCEEFKTAFQVEFYRHFTGMSLDDAMAEVARRFGLTESLVHKRWKRHHKAAADTLKAISNIREAMSEVTGIPHGMQRATRQRSAKRKR